MTGLPDAAALAARLGSLPVTVTKVRCRSGHARLADYPQGRRPTTLVELTGAGKSGFGENVAFTLDEQRAFSARAETLLAASQGTVATMVRATASAYERAALEGALIDLAMRQARISLRALTTIPAVPLRWLSSFAADTDPAARLRALRDGWGAREFKVDVDPRWSAAAVAALAAEDGVVILDFKEQGMSAACARLSAAFPRAIFEDPPVGCGHPLIAVDRPLSNDETVAFAIAAGRHINLKAPRLGGFLAVLRSLALIQARGASCYFGGMFEAGPGRTQARQLAALFCPDAPNDLGPLIGEAAAPGSSPAVIRLDAHGFGATADWAALPID